VIATTRPAMGRGCLAMAGVPPAVEREVDGSVTLAQADWPISQRQGPAARTAPVS
jgi:hypothetical protein